MKKKISELWQKTKEFSTNQLSVLRTFSFRSHIKEFFQVSLINFMKSIVAFVKAISWREIPRNIRSFLHPENVKRLRNISWSEHLESFYYFLKKVWNFLKKYLEMTEWGKRVVRYLQSEQLQNLFFSPENRGKIHRGFLVITFVTIAFFLGKTLALILRPSVDGTASEAPTIVVAKKMSKEDFDKINAHNLFHSKLDDAALGAQKKMIDLKVICEEATQETRLPLMLTSAIILQNSKKSLVVVEIKGENTRDSYRETDKIKDYARIDKIDGGRVVIKNWSTGECEYISNRREIGDKASQFTIVRGEEARRMMKNKKMDGIENNGTKYTISRKVLNKKLEDMDNILAQAKAVQLTNPDGTLSFKITEVVPGSIYNFLGIENNDRIYEINGRPIRGLNEVMNLFGNIQNMSHVEVSVMKEDGNEQKLEYDIGK